MEITIKNEKTNGSETKSTRTSKSCSRLKVGYDRYNIYRPNRQVLKYIEEKLASLPKDDSLDEERGNSVSPQKFKVIYSIRKKHNTSNSNNTNSSHFNHYQFQPQTSYKQQLSQNKEHTHSSSPNGKLNFLHFELNDHQNHNQNFKVTSSQKQNKPNNNINVIENYTNERYKYHELPIKLVESKGNSGSISVQHNSQSKVNSNQCSNLAINGKNSNSKKRVKSNVKENLRKEFYKDLIISSTREEEKTSTTKKNKINNTPKTTHSIGILNILKSKNLRNKDNNKKTLSNGLLTSKTKPKIKDNNCYNNNNNNNNVLISTPNKKKKLSPKEENKILKTELDEIKGKYNELLKKTKELASFLGINIDLQVHSESQGVEDDSLHSLDIDED